MKGGGTMAAATTCMSNNAKIGLLFASIIIFLQMATCFSSGLHSNRPTTTTTTTSSNAPIGFGFQSRGGGIIQQSKKKISQYCKIASSSPTAAKSSNNNDNKSSSSSLSSSKSVSSKNPSPQQQQGRMMISSTRLKNALILSLTATIVTIAFRERHVWMPILLNRERLQEETLRLLKTYLAPQDGGDDSIWKSLIIYGIVMAIWEFLGLSTIPVETAAAMVFGWPALLASGAGKLTGASASFIIGRTLLRNWVQQQKAVQDNVVFQILQHDNNDASSSQQQQQQHSPLQTALFMKFSCFPELIKNMGSGAILSEKKLNFWAFLLATAFHGLGFTALWTWVGVESAAAAAATAASSNANGGGSAAGMQVALLVAGAMGLILSPALMAWWIRDLRRLQKEASQVKMKQRR